MHLDGPWAEEQLACDLAVGPSRGDQPDDLDLPAGEAAVRELRGGSWAETPLCLLTERGQAVRHLIEQRSGLQPPRRAVGGHEAFHCLPPPTTHGEGCTGATR